MFRTFKFRLKEKNLSHLNKAKDDANFVWNYCNQTSIEYLDKYEKWLTGYDLDALTVGCSKKLTINSETVQSICHEFARRRNLFKKRKLAWRSRKRSLGWIPFRSRCIKVVGDSIIYKKNTLRFWKSREIPDKIQSGCFTQDARGRWYVCFSCHCKPSPRCKSGLDIGIDLGLKTFATLSNGVAINRENITLKYSNNLAIAQRAKKKKQVKKIHAKIKNIRKDWGHKQTTILTNAYDKIYVGNVSSSKLKRTRFAKSVTDASWADFKSMLAYKAIALGVEFKEVKENFSTVTCSNCFERTGPSGLSALGVREWTCKCGASHSRDVNAAINILRFGCESPIKGSLSLDRIRQ